MKSRLFAAAFAAAMFMAVGEGKAHNLMPIGEVA